MSRSSDEGTIGEINTTLLELLDYQPGELLGQHIGAILPPGGRVFYQTHVFPLLRLHGVAEEIYLSVRTRCGDEVPMLIQAVRRIYQGSAVNHCVLVPMRQRLRYEEDLLRARRVAEAAIAEAARANERDMSSLPNSSWRSSPELPPRTPGLTLVRHFEPALQL